MGLTPNDLEFLKELFYAFTGDLFSVQKKEKTGWIWVEFGNRQNNRKLEIQWRKIAWIYCGKIR